MPRSARIWDEVKRAGSIGRNRHQTHGVGGGVQQASKPRRFGGEHELRRDRPGAGRVEERPLQMRAEHARGRRKRAGGLIGHRLVDCAERRNRTLFSVGGEGRQESGDAAARQERRQRGDLTRVGIGSARAVDVEVDEAGQDSQPAQVKAFPTCLPLRRTCGDNASIDD